MGRPMPRYSRWLWVWILVAILLLVLFQPLLFGGSPIVSSTMAHLILVILLVLLLVPIVLLALIDSRRDFATPRPEEEASRRVAELQQELQDVKRELDKLQGQGDDVDRGP